jgi:hypothetical protein
MVVVSTCPRVGADYLAGTLAALDREGAADLHKIVLSDGALTGACEWPSRERIPAAKSTRANLWDAFRCALEAGAERLFYFEDDIVPCKNAIARMVAVECPDRAALMSFHDKKRFRRTHGFHLAPARDVDRAGFWGSQAVSIPRRTLEYLVTQDPYSVWRLNLARHGDRTIEEFVVRSPWPRVAYHAPSLFRHVGVVSAAHPDRFRPNRHVPDTYMGDEFDAMTL